MNFPPVKEMTKADRLRQSERVRAASLAERSTAKIRKGHARTFTRGLLSAMGDHRA